MILYTFHLYDGPETTPSFEIELFETQAAACDHARRLLRDRPHYTHVAITVDGEEVAQLHREAA